MRVAACLVAGLSLACAEAALARAPALSGSVSKKGYFVIALANNGRAAGVLATRGKEVSVTEGTPVTATLAQPMTVRVRIR